MRLTTRTNLASRILMACAVNKGQTLAAAACVCRARWSRSRSEKSSGCLKQACLLQSVLMRKPTPAPWPRIAGCAALSRGHWMRFIMNLIWSHWRIWSKATAACPQFWTWPPASLKAAQVLATLPERRLFLKQAGFYLPVF